MPLGKAGFSIHFTASGAMTFVCLASSAMAPLDQQQNLLRAARSSWRSRPQCLHHPKPARWLSLHRFAAERYPLCTTSVHSWFAINLAGKVPEHIERPWKLTRNPHGHVVRMASSLRPYFSDLIGPFGASRLGHVLWIHFTLERPHLVRCNVWVRRYGGFADDDALLVGRAVLKTTFVKPLRTCADWLVTLPRT